MILLMLCINHLEAEPASDSYSELQSGSNKQSRASSDVSRDV
jgi:hypothetical protein